MIARSAEILREMVPTGDLIVKATIRAMVGAAVLAAAQHMPEPAAHWITFGGKLFIMLAVISLFSHVEGVFTRHVADKLRVLWSQVTLRFATIMALATVWTRESREDKHGMG